MDKKISQLLIILFLIVASANLAGGWELNREVFPVQRGGNYGRGSLSNFQNPCWTKSYFHATPEQLRSLENLQRAFYKEITPIRSQYFNLYYELRARLDYPQPDAKMILEKQREIAELQKKIDEISIQYFLKARNLFSPEQLVNLPSGCNLGFTIGQGMGWGRRTAPRYR
ncbi:MAG: Spy/CpxP family protein refolding chaperone [Thermodesulfobacteriota bacterium]